MKHPIVTCATFGFRTDELDPARVTEKLGIEPSWKFKKGEEFISRDRWGAARSHRHPYGVWQLSSEGAVVGDDVDAHLLYLIDLVRPRRKAIEDFLRQESPFALLRIWWVGEGGAFGMRSDLLVQLASLADEVAITTFSSEEAGESGAPRGQNV